MLRRLMLAAALAVGFAGSAQAFHCPADVAAIDNALAKAKLSAADAAKVKTLRDEGEAAHNAGQHQQAVNTLAEAMRIILNNL